ncbi:hypothetical protein BHE74_00013023 [Ensete ventricosum]|nr:hypothetical protein BHE74_00013023 [Ensete ventricosum]
MTNWDLIPMTSTLTGFTGDAITPMGIATLPMTFGDESRTKTFMVPFMVVELSSTCNVIIGRPTLNKLRAIISIYHRNIKFSTSMGPGEVKSDPRESRRCYLAATAIPKRGEKETLIPDSREPYKSDTRPEPTEPIMEVPLEKDRPKRTDWVGSAWAPYGRLRLVTKRHVRHTPENCPALIEHCPRGSLLVTGALQANHVSDGTCDMLYDLFAYD